MQPPKAKDLVGLWRLLSVEIQIMPGKIEYPFGQKPRGTIIYLVDGKMAVHITGSDVATDRLRAYAGGWSIEGDRVVHTVEVSLEPDLRGVRLERKGELDGDRLIYRTIEAQGPGYPIVVWERVQC